uniref:Poly [ADP-ribose] polymerase 4 n=1 Tax=Phallusia mammillata TaxID=59560 RepID=A0A6F9DNF7_9ASCI|nr:poly [ADP-ribose] polymerase 4 [Phallusia mammillata]
MDPGKNKNKYRICTLELHLPFRNEEKVDQEKIGRFRIMEQTGVMEADETMTDKTSFEYFFNSCNEALMVMQYFVDKHKNKDKMQSVLSLPYHQQIGSTKLKQILDSMGSCYGKPNPEVLLLVGAIFKAVFDKFEDTDMDDISVDQINKGLVILMKIRDALKNQQPTDTLTEEYYRTIDCDESKIDILCS